MHPPRDMFMFTSRYWILREQLIMEKKKRKRSGGSVLFVLNVVVDGRALFLTIEFLRKPLVNDGNNNNRKKFRTTAEFVFVLYTRVSTAREQIERLEPIDD
jgi:hypothetical protein